MSIYNEMKGKALYGLLRKEHNRTTRERNSEESSLKSDKALCWEGEYQESSITKLLMFTQIIFN